MAPDYDYTYHRGTYWYPRPGTAGPGEIDRYFPHRRDKSGGVVAPEDKLEKGNEVSAYPLIAPANRFGERAMDTGILPPPAPEDVIGYRFARYIDQVHDRIQECDRYSKNCTVPCTMGHNVTIVLNNIHFPARVLEAKPGNLLSIQYQPVHTRKCMRRGNCPSGMVDCKIEDACSEFRPCHTPKGCLAMKDVSSLDYNNNLLSKVKCPTNSNLCSQIVQDVPAENARLMGNPHSDVTPTCRSEPAPPTPPP